MRQQQTKVITSTKLAKELLSQGFRVLDIAPHKNDSKRTIFIFELTQPLLNYINQTQNKHKEGENHNGKTEQNQLYSDTERNVI